MVLNVLFILVMELQRVSCLERYMKNKCLHLFSKFKPKCKSIQIGNGVFASKLFIIAVIKQVHGVRFEIYIMVSEIHETLGIVIGMKNFIEFEANLDTREFKFTFLSRLISIFLHPK